MNSTSTRWQWCRFHELTVDELYAVMALRQEVFAVEQNCVYLDADGLDQKSRHLLAWQGDCLVGYLRVVDAGEKFPEASIGRVVTAPSVRGGGLGKKLMQEALDRLQGEPIRISAQAYLEKFYTSLGFKRMSTTPYDEDGIPHIEMLRS